MLSSSADLWKQTRHALEGAADCKPPGAPAEPKTITATIGIRERTEKQKNINEKKHEVKKQTMMRSGRRSSERRIRCMQPQFRYDESDA